MTKNMNKIWCLKYVKINLMKMLIWHYHSVGSNIFKVKIIQFIRNRLTMRFNSEKYLLPQELDQY